MGKKDDKCEWLVRKKKRNEIEKKEIEKKEKSEKEQVSKWQRRMTRIRRVSERNER